MEAKRTPRLKKKSEVKTKTLERSWRWAYRELPASPAQRLSPVGVRNVPSRGASERPERSPAGRGWTAEENSELRRLVGRVQAPELFVFQRSTEPRRP